MPTPPLRVPSGADDRIRAGLIELRHRLDLPDGFPVAVLEAADAAVRDGGLADGRRRVDLTQVPFVTIDPPGSTDLDQAVWIGRRGRGGWTLRYAIADVAAFVTIGDPIDAEARRRGTTIYLPDGRIPLHPPVLGEHAASLRAGADRPALVWEVDLDSDGGQVDARVERAVVRSRAELDYPSVQHDLDGSDPGNLLESLRDVGRLREALERERGGVSLPLPDQEVRTGPDGRIGTEFRAPPPVEGWNAQISLLVGMAAAELMADAGIGVLRTLPPPDERTLATLRADASALGVPWPRGSSYADVVRSLDPARPTDAAFATQAARLFRGAGYLAFDEHEVEPDPSEDRSSPGPPDRSWRGRPAPVGSEAEHVAVAAPYAHVTAPLRRLVDRFANEVVVAHCAGEPVPDGVRRALPELPALMSAARSREARADGAARDLVERVSLADRSGEALAAVVVGVDERGAQLQLADPAVLARIPAGDSVGLALGQAVAVTADADGSLVRVTGAAAADELS